jgi:hypothetical protein
MYHLQGPPGLYRLLTCTLLVPASGRVQIWSADDLALLEQQGFVRFDPATPEAEEESEEPRDPDASLAHADSGAPAPKPGRPARRK